MKKRPGILILLIGMLGVVSSYFSKSYGEIADRNHYFFHLTIQHGLSQNTISSILQDRTGFMWFGTKDGLNRYDGQAFKVFKKEYGNPGSLGNNLITALLEDRDGNIWVGTDAGIYIYDPHYEWFTRFTQPFSEGKIIERTITHLYRDDKDIIWIVVESQGVFRYDGLSLELKQITFDALGNNLRSIYKDDTGRFWVSFVQGGLYYSDDELSTITAYTDRKGEEVFRNDVVSKVHLGAFNCLYVSSEREGIKEINLSKGEVRALPVTDHPGEHLFVRDFIPYTDHLFWIGTESGIYLYNIVTGKSQHLKSSFYDPYALSDNAIYCFYQDREGGLWIGSYFGGINYLPKQFTYFNKYYPTGNTSDIQAKRVREIVKGTHGTLWIGTEDNGLYLFDTQTRKFQFITPSAHFSNIHGICMVGENLWVGTFQKGIQVISPSGKLIKTYRQGEKNSGLDDNSIFTICRTMAGEVYIGTFSGLQRYNPVTDDFTSIKELAGVFVYDIKEDSKGNLWLSTYVDGAYKYDIRRRSWTHYRYEEENEHSISSHKVLSIFEDSKGDIWLTTQGGGFCLYDSSSDNFRRYFSGNGFPFDVVYQIVEDNDSFFWLTTNDGLVRMNPRDMSFHLFTEADGLLSKQFNYKSGYKDAQEMIWLGNQEGLISFDPRSITVNREEPPVVITDFLLFNKKVTVAEEGAPLQKSITHSNHITLKAGQNSFTFRLAVLSYRNSRLNELVYKLEGFDKDWLPVTESPLVNYSNIRHGNYLFRVKGINDENGWDGEERQLSIRILPPFYLSLWAYFIYFLLFTGCICSTIFFFIRKNEAKQKRLMELFNQEKERELHSAKIDFFTNVAHEIRTPLTLIKGPLDNILRRQEVSPQVKEDLLIMHKNTDRLLSLTNQLLDFRKTEINGFRLTYEECNITELLRETYIRFKPLKTEKQLSFTIHMPGKPFYAHVDKEAFTKIISNLFTNAIKYAESKVEVSLTIEETPDLFEIRVANDGRVIPVIEREEVFKPFVRLEQENDAQPVTGTGIGLTLARSLAELHRGGLHMSSSTELNEFILKLPVTHTHVIRLKPAEDITEPGGETPFTRLPDTIRISDNQPSLLIVEDNPEMQRFIARQLSEHYNVFTASNGREALDVLDTQYIHLVVCDILMPVMNGYDFCKKIKSDITYSHIPVILLTARTNIQSKIEGMEAGADAYIEKPFSQEYLLATISNLLQTRTHLKEAFTQSPNVKVNTIAATRQDDEFLTKLVAIIDENMKNPGFSIDDMAETFFMSRSSFYRKIKGIVGVSPNEYLRLERLKKAARLLEEQKGFVNEVCYMVGFNSPSYFTKCFYKQFGVLPKDYVKQEE